MSIFCKDINKEIETGTLDSLMAAFQRNPKETLKVCYQNQVYLPIENSIDMAGDSLSEWHEKELLELKEELDNIKEEV